MQEPLNPGQMSVYSDTFSPARFGKGIYWFDSGYAKLMCM